jgi:hypothetical protein
MARGAGSNVVKDSEKMSTPQDKRRSFDFASRGKAARGSAQDDSFFIQFFIQVLD